MSTALKVYDAMMATDYCSQWMGLEPIHIAEGHCVLRMQVRREMLNGHGILHGGIAFAFADSALAFASNSYGRQAVSIQASMNYVRSAHKDDVLIAEAKALHVGHRTGDFDVSIRRENEEDPLYYFRGTVYRTSKEVIQRD